MIRLKFGRRPGRHRLQPGQHHRGWEDREHEIPLLATAGLLADHDALQTTTPLRGLPITGHAHCPIDDCDWPTNTATGIVDPHLRLLEHLRWHTPIDVLHTITRLRHANNKLQGLLG